MKINYPKLILVYLFIFVSSTAFANSAQNGEDNSKSVKQVLKEIEEKQNELYALLSQRKAQASGIMDAVDLIDAAASLSNSPRDQVLASVGFIISKKPAEISKLSPRTLGQLKMAMAPSVTGGAFLCNVVVDEFVIRESGAGYFFDPRFYDILRAPPPELSSLISDSVGRGRSQLLATAYMDFLIKQSGGQGRPADSLTDN